MTPDQIEEARRQCELMLDMADQNISELQQLADTAEAEARAADLRADFEAAEKMIRNAAGAYVMLRDFIRLTKGASDHATHNARVAASLILDTAGV